eukprot:2741389-Pleurochrysis_carterae.AAC.1
MTKSNRSAAQRIFSRGGGRSSPEVPSVGDTSTVHRYGLGATRVLRVSAVRALRLCISKRMN